MTDVFYYEAPRGVAPETFVDAIDLPSSLRVVARPLAKSLEPMASDILTALGSRADGMYTRAKGTSGRLSLATARCLAQGVRDIYVGEAQDLLREAVEAMVEFAGRTGARLHLVFSFGQTHPLATTLIRFGAAHRPYGDLPEALRTPPQRPDSAPQSAVPLDLDSVAIPDDHWMTFRSTYQVVLPPPIRDHADLIYLDAYARTRASTAETKDDIAALIADIWRTHGLSELERTVAVRAIQAGLFRNGLNVRVHMDSLAKYVKQHLLNPLTTQHYLEMAGFGDPWRAAAATLHAHHVTTERMLELKALDVARDGDIPSLGMSFEPAARYLLCLQRWRQLIVAEADPPLFATSRSVTRTGIRDITAKLGLPLVAEWRRQAGDRWQQKHGLQVERYA